MTFDFCFGLGEGDGAKTIAWRGGAGFAIALSPATGEFALRSVIVCLLTTTFCSFFFGSLGGRLSKWMQLCEGGSAGVSSCSVPAPARLAIIMSDLGWAKLEEGGGQ